MKKFRSGECQGGVGVSLAAKEGVFVQRALNNTAVLRTAKKQGERISKTSTWEKDLEKQCQIKAGIDFLLHRATNCECIIFFDVDEDIGPASL